METKINIAAILKDKPQGTKLYDWLHNIDVEYGDYIQYQLNRKYYITEEDMQKLSGIYNRDFYK